MNLDMTCDDLKSKTMKDQPEQKANGEKAKGPHLLSSRCWCPVAVTLAILCLGLLVTVIMLTTQLSQVSDLLKKQQANLTHQENILEGQLLAQKQGEKACHEQQRELKETVETLAQKLEEKSQKQAELYQQNLNLQEILKKAANFSGPCPQDWLWHEKNCYFFSADPFNWEKSQENCLSLGAQMLKINSTYDLEFIKQASAHSSFPFWTGLSRRKPSYSWLWEDGSPLMPNVLRLQGAISQRNPSDTCAYLQRGTVFADNCILTAYSICQKAATLIESTVNSKALEEMEEPIFERFSGI
ncbi:oxidized low-density lipoprotein receptor 1 [Phyllostomus hastatus]|uniref:oxidized low-density lipoprotein receptor 1 n=1 Tax=Phyllostomus hastatus TaxID=9423 RepID=UPI001E67E0DB|nr:oxidized low-density lipoprotein receptor 1 [Phyllostomus hastatus]